MSSSNLLSSDMNNTWWQGTYSEMFFTDAEIESYCFFFFSFVRHWAHQNILFCGEAKQNQILFFTLCLGKASEVKIFSNLRQRHKFLCKKTQVRVRVHLYKALHNLTWPLIDG